MPTTDSRVRLDKWLWAARFFKTRALAAAAIDGGKVQLNGERAKRAKPVQAGDTLRIRHGTCEHTVVVRALSESRGPATRAAELYEETRESVEARERMALQLKTLNAAFSDTGERPTKRDRRRLEEFRRRGGAG